MSKTKRRIRNRWTDDLHAHWGFDLSFDMTQQEFEQEDELIQELDDALHQIFKAWKLKAKKQGVTVTNVKWE